MKFPSDKQIKKAMEILDKAPGSTPLPKDATKSDALKYALCSNFVVYRREKKLSQKDLAERIGLDPAQVSKILHYHIEEFSLDFLLTHLLKIYPKAHIKIDLAS